MLLTLALTVFAIVAPTALAAKPVISRVSPDHGPASGGTVVTITGNKFAGSDLVSSVTFDGVAASFTVDGNDQITAVAPAHSGSGAFPLTLTNPDGSKSTTFTYDAAAPSSTTPAPTSSSPAPTTTATPSPSETSPSETSPPATTSAPAPATTSEPPPGPTSAPAPTTSAAAAPPPAPYVPPPVYAPSPSPASTSAEPARTAPAMYSPVPAATCSSDVASGTEPMSVPLPRACGVESMRLRLSAPGVHNLTVQRLASWPEGVSVPDFDTVPALAFFAEIRNATGAIVEPENVTLQVRVPADWLDACSPPACRAHLFHFHDGAWSRQPLVALGLQNGTVILEAGADGFSLFVVAGVKGATGSSLAIARYFNMGALPVLGIGAVGVFAVMQRMRRNPPREMPPGPAADPQAGDKVSRLLREMKNKEELLQFVNNAAHDLANPLTPIHLQLELLSMAARENEDEKQQKSLDVVRRNVEQLSLLVTDLRDASKLQAGKLRLVRGRLDLAMLAGVTVESYAEQAKRAGVELVVGEAKPLPVEADATRLTQVVTNFLNNALKFTPQGGRITVDVAQEGTDALLLVRDTGMGLSKEDQDLLFKPFSQAHGETQKKKGTGLGLFISKGIVESHGGRIGCRSEGAAQGSTFWFALPIMAAEPEPPAPSETEPVTQANPL